MDEVKEDLELVGVREVEGEQRVRWKRMISCAKTKTTCISGLSKFIFLSEHVCKTCNYGRWCHQSAEKLQRSCSGPVPTWIIYNASRVPRNLYSW